MAKLIERLGNFLQKCSPIDMAILLTLIIIPIVVVILIVVAIVKRARRSDDEMDESAEAEQSGEEIQPKRSSRINGKVPVGNGRIVRVSRKVDLSQLGTLDKSFLLATGIFCFGLGAMIQNSMFGNNR